MGSLEENIFGQSVDCKIVEWIYSEQIREVPQLNNEEITLIFITVILPTSRIS